MVEVDIIKKICRSLSPIISPLEAKNRPVAFSRIFLKNKILIGMSKMMLGTFYYIIFGHFGNGKSSPIFAQCGGGENPSTGCGEKILTNHSSKFVRFISPHPVLPGVAIYFLMLNL